MAGLSKVTNLLSFPKKLKKNFDWIFFLLLIVLLVTEGITIRKSVTVIFDAQKSPPIAPSNKGVRINMKDYNDAVERIQNASSFAPTPEAGVDPFSSKRAYSGTDLPASQPELPISATTSPQSSSTSEQ